MNDKNVLGSNTQFKLQFTHSENKCLLLTFQKNSEGLGTFQCTLLIYGNKDK